jgi:signal peptidase II
MSSEGRARGGIVKPAVLLLTALVILVADQLSKGFVVAALALGQQVHVIGDFVEVWNVQNRGAAFSLLQGGSILFLLVSVLSVGMVWYFHRVLRGRPLWIHLVLGIFLGGALGNFVDRLRQGYVTDWLSVGIGDLRWPTFNVADSSLVIGIGILVLYLMLARADPQEAAA